MESDQRQGAGTGHGKLILFGEHTVVYGAPAVVAGLERGAEATAGYGSKPSTIELAGPMVSVEPEQQAEIDRAFEAILEPLEAELDGPVDVEVEIDIPVGVGLGSSAALSAAVARALADLGGCDDPDVVERAVSAGEEVFHGNPSGIDQLAALRGGVHFYRAAERTEVAPIEASPFRVGVCVAGPPAPTSEMVSRVAERRERDPDLFEHLKLLVGDTARAASGVMRDRDWERVGALMDINHGALVSLGVSTSELDAACHLAREAGAFGAKLTGAGGGGCAIALLPDGDDAVLEAWRREGYEAFEAEI